MLAPDHGLQQARLPVNSHANTCATPTAFVAGARVLCTRRGTYEPIFTGLAR